MTRRGEDLQRRLMLRGVASPDLDACDRLARCATTLNRLGEESCNGPGAWVDRIPYPRAGEIYAAHETRVARDTGRAEARAARAAAVLGFDLVIQGDPRGAPLGLITDPSDPERVTWVY